MRKFRLIHVATDHRESRRIKHKRNAAVFEVFVVVPIEFLLQSVVKVVVFDGNSSRKGRSRVDLRRNYVYMRLIELFVTGYKNLNNCRFAPTGLHAITGCNSSGKSNLLDAVPFVMGLHSFSDENRSEILVHGKCPVGTWFPDTKDTQYRVPFRFALVADVAVGGVDWRVTYELELPALDYKGEGDTITSPGFISQERILAKRAGAPGKAAVLLSRGPSGITTVIVSGSKRGRNRFRTKRDMSALQALEIREAEDFEAGYPVLAAFRKSFLLTHSLTLDPATFATALLDTERKNGVKRGSTGYVSAFDPYDLLEDLGKNKELWTEYRSWLKRLAGIDNMVLVPYKVPDGSTRRYIFPSQHGRVLFPDELSTGATLIVATVTAVYTFLRKGGLLLIEEPETRLHPAAIVDLITLFRDVAKDRSIVFSTHSPVALNSMNPSEVTVMRPLENGFFTTQAVSELDEAIAALDRNFLNFGDLLQLNFKP